MEYHPTGALARRFVHGPGTDEPLVWYGSGGTVTRFLHADERGSIVSATDVAGNPVVTYRYDEYGGWGSSNSGTFFYTGQTGYTELGLYYYKNRWRHPKLDRFMQTDPIGYGDGMNMYAYVRGDPVNFTDPSGLAGEGNDYSDIFVNGRQRFGATGTGGSGQSAGGLDLTAFFTSLDQSPNNDGDGDGKPDPDILITAILPPPPGIGHNRPPNDPPPVRPWYHYSRLGSTLGALLSLGGDTCAVCDISLDGVLDNPGSLYNLTLDQVHSRLGTPKGWVWTRNFQGTQAGKGWVLRQWGGQAWTGRQIRWHPGGGRHGPDSYWRVNNGNGQSSRIPSGGRW